MKRLLLTLQSLLLALLVLTSPFAVAAQEDRAVAEVQRQQVQPYNNAPVWREVRSGQPQFTTVRGVDTNVLIQSTGQTWREVRNGPIAFYGGILLSVVVIALLAFYLIRGPIRVHEPPTGRRMLRFTPAERVVHWSMAFTFVTLMVTGLIMFFGKWLLLPLFGYTLFSWVALFSKNLHNFVGPLFLVSILVGIPMFMKDNSMRSYDWTWLKMAGGLFTGKHVASHRFNAGEKLMFWSTVVVLSLIIAISGLVLNFPNFEQGRQAMQLASVTHWVAAMLAMCVMLGHIYVGTIGIEGALDSMRTGYVDESWAKEHHEYWYNDEKAAQQAAGDRVPPAGSALPQP